MLCDRGYAEDDISELKRISENETHYQNRFHITLNDLCIVFDLNQKFSRDIVEYVNELDTRHIIFVIKASLNTTDIKKITSIESDGKNCEIFSLLELQFNKSKHFLVPKHELINDENVIEDLIKTHYIKNRSQFPHILKSDPMCKYLNAKQGNIVKIYRSSPTSGESIVYRTVV